MMLPPVAAGTKGLKIVDIEKQLLIAVVRHDMVDLSRRHREASTEAVLAKRMRRNVIVPERAPAAVVAALGRGMAVYLLDDAWVSWR